MVRGEARDGGPRSGGAAPDRSGGRVVPWVVGAALRVLLALVVVLAGGVAMTYLLHDDLVRAWANGNPNTREILRDQGLAGLEESGITIPGFGPLAVVSFVVFATLAWVLVAFLRRGAAWSRLTLTAVAVLGVGMSAVGLSQSPPVAFLVFLVVVMVLCLALAGCLWHPSARPWFSR